MLTHKHTLIPINSWLYPISYPLHCIGLCCTTFIIVLSFILWNVEDNVKPAVMNVMDGSRDLCTSNKCATVSKIHNLFIKFLFSINFQCLFWFVFFFWKTKSVDFITHFFIFYINLKLLGFSDFNFKSCTNTKRVKRTRVDFCTIQINHHNLHSSARPFSYFMLAFGILYFRFIEAVGKPQLTI